MRLRRRTTVLTSTLAAGALTLTLAGPALADSAPQPSTPSATSFAPSTGEHRDDTVPYAPKSTPAATPLTADQLRSAAGVTTLSAAAASTTVHQLDIVIANPTGAKSTATTASVNSLVADVSSYWSAQTNGKVAFAVKTIKSITTSEYCGTNYGIGKIWSQASKAVSGKDWWSDGRPTSGPAAREHLVVLYPYEVAGAKYVYGEGVCDGTLGLGTTPATASVSNNGLTFALFGSTDPSVTSGADPQFYTARQSLAHELGHNFGLQHAGTWWCQSGANDGTWLSSLCSLFNYVDPFDVMGFGYGDQGVPALSGPQKLRLGVLSSSRHKTITDTSSVSLQPVPQSEKGAPAGLQAAQVKDPSTGETYTVEYRPDLGDVTFPMGSPLGTMAILDGAGSDTGYRYTLGYGVRVLRLAPRDVTYSDGSAAWYKNEQSLIAFGASASPYRTSYLPAGQTFTTRSGKVSIRVASQGSTATVAFVVHRKARLSLSRSATSQRYRQTAVRLTARTATTNGAVPTGTVTFKDGTKALKTVATSSTGVASYTLPKTLSVKAHTITATFTPNAATKARSVEATSASTRVTVTKSVSSIGVRLAATTVHKGAKPKLTVHVTVRGYTGPTGVVRIYENGHKVKAVTLYASRKGTFTVTLPRTTRTGTVKIVAKYSGASTILSKTSATLRLRVI